MVPLFSEELLRTCVLLNLNELSDADVIQIVELTCNIIQRNKCACFIYKKRAIVFLDRRYAFLFAVLLAQECFID